MKLDLGGSKQGGKDISGRVLGPAIRGGGKVVLDRLTQKSSCPGSIDFLLERVPGLC